jgi:hypothetical protein
VKEELARREREDRWMDGVAVKVTAAVVAHPANQWGERVVPSDTEKVSATESMQPKNRLNKRFLGLSGGGGIRTLDPPNDG